MVGDSSDILGIEIPSTDPIFIAVIVGIHISLGLACVGAGAVAMLARNPGHYSAVLDCLLLRGHGPTSEERFANPSLSTIDRSPARRNGN